MDSKTIIVMLFDLLFLLVFLAFHVTAGFLGLRNKGAALTQGVSEPAWIDVSSKGSRDTGERSA